MSKYEDISGASRLSPQELLQNRASLNNQKARSRMMVMGLTCAAFLAACGNSSNGNGNQASSNAPNGNLGPAGVPDGNPGTNAASAKVPDGNPAPGSLTPQTTFKNLAKYCGGPSQRIICEAVPLEDGSGSIAFSVSSSSSPTTPNSFTLPDGTVFMDVIWTVNAVAGTPSLYLYQGDFGNGHYTTRQTMKLTCQTGRHGGCEWTNQGGTTTVR